MAEKLNPPAPKSAAPTPSSHSGSAFDYKAVLQHMIQANASDLHLKVGRPPTLRVDGHMVSLEMPALRQEDLRSLAEQIMAPKNIKEFSENKESDFALAVPGIGRFRVNAYQQRGTIAYALRTVPFQAKTIAELNLPEVCERISLMPRGLILVTGITGSGKSTALASMLHYINQNRHANIITIEDPIEFLHRDIKSSINQREVGTDTNSFAQALRRVLRQDPDILLVGEIRDLDTLDTALKAAETGHLVFSTLHTIDASKTVDRIVGTFDSGDQHAVRSRLAASFRYFISQRLVPKISGGRIAVLEVLKSTMRTRDYIERGDEEGPSLLDAMRDGELDGMQHFDGELEKLTRAGVITTANALLYATNAGNLTVQIADLLAA
jgi:twitching motility protein PilT